MKIRAYELSPNQVARSATTLLIAVLFVTYLVAIYHLIEDQVLLGVIMVVCNILTSRSIWRLRAITKTTLIYDSQDGQDGQERP